jgi:hypothetical protein
VEGNNNGNQQQGDPKKITAPPPIAKDDSATASASAPNDNQQHANKRMPRWTINWTAILAIGTVVLGCAAIWSDVLISGQLTEMRNAGEDTRRAVEATNRLADTARDQVNIAKDTEQRQLRAYVFPTVSIANVNGDVSKIETTTPKIEMIIKNFGLTPAYEIDIMGLARLYEFPASISIHYERVGTRKSVNLAPGATDPAPIAIENVNGPLTKDQKLALINKSAAIYLIGEILYRDAFSKLWCTKFSYYVGGDAGFYGIGMADASEGQETDKNCHEPVRGEPPRLMSFPPKPNPR